MNTLHVCISKVAFTRKHTLRILTLYTFYLPQTRVKRLELSSLLYNHSACEVKASIGLSTGGHVDEVGVPSVPAIDWGNKSML